MSALSDSTYHTYSMSQKNVNTSTLPYPTLPYPTLLYLNNYPKLPYSALPYLTRTVCTYVCI